MAKANTFSKYGKKESANVRRCLVNNKKNIAPKTEYVSNKKKQIKKSKPEHENNSDDDDDEKLVNGRPAPKPKNIKVEYPVYEVMPEALNFVRLIDTGLFARLLYPNPVCFLTTLEADFTKRNVMTVSWLAPANNYGGFVMVVHKTRHSAANLAHHKTFNLSVANASHIELLSNIGKRTGKNGDKFDGSITDLATTPFAKYNNDSVPSDSTTVKSEWTYIKENTKEVDTKKLKKVSSSNAFMALNQDSSDEEEEEQGSDDDEEEENQEEAEEVVTGYEESKESEVITTSTSSSSSSATPVKKVKPLADPLFVSTSVAHLKCIVQSIGNAADEGHFLVVASIVDAAVHPQYWIHNGKCLSPENKELPGLVSFLGSQQFGVTTSL